MTHFIKHCFDIARRGLKLGSSVKRFRRMQKSNTYAFFCVCSIWYCMRYFPFFVLVPLIIDSFGVTLCSDREKLLCTTNITEELKCVTARFDIIFFLFCSFCLLLLKQYDCRMQHRIKLNLSWTSDIWFKLRKWYGEKKTKESWAALSKRLPVYCGKCEKFSEKVFVAIVWPRN